ncbi:MAG: phosphatidylglycerol lysyltransferase domain-containing protein [Tepidamorphaceae bacterium]
MRHPAGAPFIPLAVRAIVRKSSDPTARLAFSGDKRVLVDDADTAFLMYAVQRRSWVAVGMPQGAPEAASGLLWRFRELAELEGGVPAVFNVAASDGPALEEIGLVLAHTGDRAVVSTSRSAAPPKLPAGWSVSPAAAMDGDVPSGRLADIEVSWRGRHPYAETGFMQGRLSPDGAARGDLVLLVKDHRIEGFAVIWTEGTDEAVLDVLRLSQEAEETLGEAALEALAHCAIAHAHSAGAARLRLGLVPPEGLDKLLLAPALQHAGPAFWSHGGHFTAPGDLRRFILSFDPELQPRHIATAGGVALSAAVMDTATLLTGRPVPRRPRIDIRPETPAT